MRIDDAEVIRLTAGEGVWIPAEGWGSRAVVTDPGTVAFPVWADLGAASSPEPTRFEVSRSWQDWLIQYFNLQVTPLTGQGYSPARIAALVRRSRTRPLSGDPAGGPAQGRIAPLALPNTRRAAAVAEEVLRDPACDLTVEQWAARVLCSPRTLRRDFLAGSGLTFEQWRLRCRLRAAVELLTAGCPVDQVTARVGFTSRSGLSRAFRHEIGVTPHQLRRQVLAERGAERGGSAPCPDDADVPVPWGRGAVPDPLPAVHTPPHTNNSHVLSWMYRGTGYLDIGDRRYVRRRGVATWVPADTEHTTGVRENSVSLPLGNAGTGELLLTEPLQVRFSPAWDDYLMYCSISARSILRPDDYDPRHVVELFAKQLAAQRAMSVPMPTDPVARSVALDYLRRIAVTGEPAASDVGSAIHEAFRRETGMSFSRWCYGVRMRTARDLLIGGSTPSAVARRIGYRHLPTFSAAFTRFHGMSPRTYQEREIGQS
ncbi:AraC family transcriptional regulator [Pseudonocardia sp. TMWB2A]|uniref:AraC family transcriptional regulator n=1 Tax=Pseudonocardia sp. TMWB2A TaxID=687430 RepID=UPI00307E18F3